MARNVSVLTKHLMQRETVANVAVLAFLDLDLGVSGMLRVVNNWESVTRNSNVYQPYFFAITLPRETTNADVPEVQLRIDNIDQSIIAGIQQLTDPVPVELNIANSLTPDVAEAGPFNFTIQRIDFDDRLITAAMTYETVLVRAFPDSRFVPSDFPGAF